MAKESLYIKYLDSNGKEQTFPSGGAAAVLGTYTYSAERMGSAPTITATLYYPKCLDSEWTKKEYVTFGGEKYRLSQIPSSSKSDENIEYKHEVTFVSARVVLDNVYFLDVVSDNSATTDADGYRSNSTEFSFMGNIQEFVARINDSLIYSGLYDADTGEGYHVVIDDGVETDEDVSVSISDLYISEALEEIYNSYGLIYYWDGETCHVGDAQYTPEEAMKYGADGMLLSVSKENADYRIITRVSGRGGTDNIPYYYPNESATGDAVYELSNLTDDDVKKIDLNTILGYNSEPYNTAVILYKRGGAKVSYPASPLFSTYTGVNTSGTNRLEINLSTAGDLRATRIYVSIYIKGRKGATLQFGSDVIGVKTSEENVWPWPSCSYIMYESDGQNTACPWEDESGFSRLYDDEIAFTNSDWHTYSFVFTVPQYDTSMTILSIRVSGIMYTLGSEDEYVWKYGDNTVAYESSGITLTDIDSAVAGALTMSYDGGQWKETFGSSTDAATVTLTGCDYITAASALMPSIYRNSGGKDRFYNALNETYKDENGDYYTFENTYDKSDPHEGITEFEDIYPTIKGITNAAGELIAVIEDVAFDTDDSDATRSTSDSDSENAEYVHSYFYVKLRVFDGDYGFNLFEHASYEESAYLNMTNGSCSSCAFEIAVEKEASDDGTSYKFYNPVITDEDGNLVKVKSSSDYDGTDGSYWGDYILPISSKSEYVDRQQDTSKYSVWIAVKKDNSTFGFVMPNVMYGNKSKAGNTFVLTGIYLPKAYVTAAEERLDAALIEYMKANNEEKFTFSVKFSRIWIEQHASIAEQINENTKLTVRYNGQDYVLYVSSYTCKADEEVLYEITVDLSDTLTVAQSSIKQQIDAAKIEILSGIGTKKSTSSSGNTSINTSNIVSAVENYFLRKDIADTAAGVITFGKGLVSNGDARIVGELVAEGAAEFQKAVQHGDWTYFGEFVASLYAGKGAGVDASGNMEVESLKVRSALEVLELIVNRLSAIEGDQLLTEADTIESIVDVGNGVYGLYLREKWDGYFTAQAENNVLKGIINTLAEGSGDYYTSWMRVNSVDTANNYIEVVLYDDEDTPAGKNYPPCETMKIARWGNQTDTDRQSCLYLSSTEGRIVKLRDVTKPILDDANYGTVLGTIPEFVKNLTTASGGKVVTYDNRDYLYAMGVIVQDFIQIDYQGNPVCTYVDRGEWVEGGLYYCQEKNPETGIYEISDVWHFGCKWRCAKNLTTEEPVFNQTDWAMIEGDPTFKVDFVEQEQLYDADNFSAALTIVAMLYNQDVTEHVNDTDVVWTRYTEDSEGNQRTDSDTIWNNNRGSAGKSIILTKSDLNIETYMPPVIKFTATVTLRTSDGTEVATQSISLEVK